MAGGGDFYQTLKDACRRPGGYCVDTGILMLDALVDEFSRNSPVQRGSEGRLLAR
jgi:5'-nucleotidase